MKSLDMAIPSKHALPSLEELVLRITLFATCEKAKSTFCSPTRAGNLCEAKSQGREIER